MDQMVKRFWNDESGQGLTEYGLLIAAVVVIVFAMMTLFHENLDDFFKDLGSEMDATPDLD